MEEGSLFFVEADEVTVPIDSTKLYAFQRIPQKAKGLVVIAHGSGSSRFSFRDQFVARMLYEEGLGVFLMDLLTREEEAIDLQTAELRFDIPFLAKRLIEVTRWLHMAKETHALNIGYFGASTGAAAALVAAAEQSDEIQAVVSRGGRPDLAGDALTDVTAATLLIVGGNDYDVLELNQQAYNQLNGMKKLEIVPEATHLFEEAGAMEQVATLAKAWFGKYLQVAEK